MAWGRIVMNVQGAWSTLGVEYLWVMGCASGEVREEASEP